MPIEKWVPTVCWACIEGCCAIKVQVIDGAATRVEGNTAPSGFDTLSKNQGKICPKAFAHIQKLYNPHRITGPLKRTNPGKGPGVNPGWAPVSWDEALDTVAARLKDIRSGNTMRLWRGFGGPQTTSLIGTWEPFFTAFGPSQRVQGGSSIRCDMGEHVFGNIIHGGFHCEPDLTYCNYLILLSENPSGSGGGPANIQFSNARARGMKTVVVDPVFSLSAAKADEWLPIRPGTDAAFLLALIDVIVNEIGTVDREFLRTMTDAPYLVNAEGHFCRHNVNHKPLVWDPVEGRAKAFDDPSVKDMALEGSYPVDGGEARTGFQMLKDHVRQYTPEWAAGVTDIPSATIRRIAREWVENARIGSNIEIDGITFPYRPVATKVGRGITGSMHPYPTVLANHILGALVGALEVPGSHCGGRWKPEDSNHGITPGPDGLPVVEKFPFTWPPISYDFHETLFPYSKQHGFYAHLSFLNVVAPRKGFEMPAPEAYIRYRCNPLSSIGQKDVVAGALMKIPFIVSIGYVFDEMTDYSDIILPEHTELERFELCPRFWRSAGAKRYYGYILRQPVVAPRHNTMDLSDILTGLAERLGFLKEYNAQINGYLSLKEPFALETDKKYAWTEIVDRHCRSLTKGAHDLAWFQENAGVVYPVSARQQYEVYLGMKENGVRYQLPYLEDVKKTGEELARHIASQGIDWWSTAEYVALPTYVPPIYEKCDSKYDLYVTTSKSMQFSWGMNADMPWLIELGHQVEGHDTIVMNAATAAKREIKDGDEVTVESEVGKVRGRVKLVHGIRLDTIAIVGQFGQWTMPVAKDTGRVSQSPLLPIRYEWTDKLVGTMQGQVVKARVIKD